MLFFPKQITIAFLINNRLILSFFKKTANKAKLTKTLEIQYSLGEVNNGRITDLDAVKKKINDLLIGQKQNLARVLILLPEQVVFFKGFKIEPDFNPTAAQEQFLSEIPYPRQDLLLKSMTENSNLQLMAVEKNLVTNLKAALLGAKVKVEAIVPLPGVISILFPQDTPSILITSLDGELVLVHLLGQTVFFSETQKIQAKNLESTVISALQSLQQLPNTHQIKNVVLLGIASPLLVQELTGSGFKVTNLQFEGDILQQLANFWFKQPKALLAQDLSNNYNKQSKEEKGILKNKFRLVAVIVIVLLLAGLTGFFFHLANSTKIVKI